MAKPKFNCSQAVLVLAIETILNSMEEYLSDFTAFKPKYVLAWITARRTELTTADLLPNEEARRAASSILRVQLAKQNIICCALWQKLARYINGAYAANVVDIQLAAAGQSKYQAAKDENWAEGKSMLTSAQTFLTDNLATLTADGNMDAAFATEFNAAAVLFKSILTGYENSKEAILVATSAKVDAFNAIYDTVIAMCLDGQEIFRDNETVHTQFVFTNVVDRISGPGLAGARGTVTNSTDSFPIEGALATISLASNPAIIHTATTGADGKYLVNCPSGDYLIKFTAVNYVPGNVKDIRIEVGTVSTFNEKLTPLEGGG